MPESVVKTSDDKNLQTRRFSLAPVTATVGLNVGHNNAHSVSLGASLDEISLSGSNSYTQPAGNDGYMYITRYFEIYDLYLNTRERERERNENLEQRKYIKNFQK